VKKPYHQIADITVLALLTLVIVWYIIDTFRASTHIINLILVLPVGVGVIVLCGIQLFNQIQGPTSESFDLEPFKPVLPLMGLFSAYILTLEWLGFDIGTSVFVSLSLWLHGEKRLVWVIAYGTVFGFCAAWFFSTMLPYPMPMLILPTEY